MDQHLSIAPTENLPAELLEELDRAADFAAHLAASGRELHFEIDPATHRPVVELRSASGLAPKRLSCLEAADLVARG